MVSFHELRGPRGWANEVVGDSKQCMYAGGIRLCGRRARRQGEKMALLDASPHSECEGPMCQKPFFSGLKSSEVYPRLTSTSARAPRPLGSRQQ